MTTSIRLTPRAGEAAGGAQARMRPTPERPSESPRCVAWQPQAHSAPLGPVAAGPRVRYHVRVRGHGAW
eukprot:6786182-Prorocentrum_lima.AAC.1